MKIAHLELMRLLLRKVPLFFFKKKKEQSIALYRLSLFFSCLYVAVVCVLGRLLTLRVNIRIVTNRRSLNLISARHTHSKGQEKGNRSDSFSRLKVYPRTVYGVSRRARFSAMR